MEVNLRSHLCFPELLNSSCRKPVASWSDVVFLHFVLSSVSVLTVILNLLVVASVSHFRQLHSPTNLLLLSLAVSDFLVGFVFIPGEIYRISSCWFLGDLVCSLYKFAATLCISASVGNMVLISADRYVAICHPLRYPTRVTVGRVRLCIILCWFLSIFYSSLFAKDNWFQRDQHKTCSGKCRFYLDYISVVVDLFVSFIVPVSIIMVLYIRVFVVAVTQARAMRSNVRAVTFQHLVTVTSRKSELKAARTLGIIVVVFLMCFCPYNCVSLTGSSLFNPSYGVFVLYLLCFNSCFNPLIYALFYPWFRKAVKLIVSLQVLQPGSSGTNVL